MRRIVTRAARGRNRPRGVFLLAALLLATVLASGCGPGPSGTPSPPASAAAHAPGAAQDTLTAPPGAGGSAGAEGSATPTLGPPPPTLAAGGCAARRDPPAGRTWFDCLVPAPSLAGNVLEDPASLGATVVLPRGYAATRRYPTIYFLGAFASPPDVYDGALAEGLATDALPGARAAILVFVNGMNTFGGSFYVNSAVSGRWEDAIATDVVAFVDGRYSTIHGAASRGLAGDGMGGFGALSIAMHHPETFGAVYSMNADLPDDARLMARFGDPAVVAEVLTAVEKLGAMTQSDARSAIDLVANESATTEDAFGYGAAFAPDASANSFMRYPFARPGGSVVRNDAVWNQWLTGIAQWPAKIARYRAPLRGLRGIGLDYDTSGANGPIGQENHAVAELLRAAGAKVTENTFEGDALGSLPERLVAGMLPFFSAALAA